jgi:hypothetical protein
MGCVVIGTVFSLAVFLQPMSVATGWSRTGISSAMTIVFVTVALQRRTGHQALRYRTPCEVLEAAACVYRGNASASLRCTDTLPTYTQAQQQEEKVLTEV